MRRLGFLALLACAAAIPAQAQQLTYTPVNPAFGGSSFNYSYLQGTADAQNEFKNKPKAAATTDYTKQFIQMLQSRLYSGLAQKVSDTLFGENCNSSCSGEIALGDQKVAYSNDGSQITLNITDAAGTVTTISVPTLSTSTY